MRTSGLLRSPASLQPGDHVCWSYRSDDEHRRVLTEYVTEGVRQRFRVVYFHEQFDPAATLEFLAEAGLAVDELTSRGQLMMVPARAAYTPDGNFDPGRMLEAFRTHAFGALEDGFAGLHAAGEADWVVPALIDTGRYVAYEHQADGVVVRTPMVGLCMYDARIMDPATLRRIEAAHAARIRPKGIETDVDFYFFATESGDVALAGEIDLASVDLLKLALRSAAAHRGDVSLDLSAVSFIDLCGLRELAAAARTLGEEGRELRLISPPAALRRVAGLVAFDRLPNVRIA